MAERVAQRFCPLPPDVGLERAVAWLVGHGYQLSARSGLTAQLFHPGGLDPEPPRHRLVVTASAQRLDFTYQRASIFDAEPAPAEQARFERAIDQLLVAITGQPAPPDATRRPETPRFCPECGTRTEAGATVCTMCGATF